MTYGPSKFEVATLYMQQFRRRCIYIESTLFDLDLGVQVTQNVAQNPPHHNYLRTFKVWSCYMQWFRRRCIYKKVQYLMLTLGSRSHKMLPSTLYIIWPMHLQSLKCFFQWFRRICIYKKIYNLTFGVKVTQNITQYPLHHVIFVAAKFKVALTNCLGEDTITRKVTDTQTYGWMRDRLWYKINIPY